MTVRIECAARSLVRCLALMALLGSTAAVLPAHAGEDDGEPAFVAGGVGPINVSEEDIYYEMRLEYRHDERFWIFKPIAGLHVVSDGSFYGFGGVQMDFYLGRRWVFSPSFGAGYYSEGDDLALGYELEFRSGAEIAYRFDDRSRLGVAVHHLSNANLGDKNPGTESVTLYYAMPLNQVLGDND